MRWEPERGADDRSPKAARPVGRKPARGIELGHPRVLRGRDELADDLTAAAPLAGQQACGEQRILHATSEYATAHQKGVNLGLMIVMTEYRQADNSGVAEPIANPNGENIVSGRGAESADIAFRVPPRRQIELVRFLRQLREPRHAAIVRAADDGLHLEPAKVIVDGHR